MVSSGMAAESVESIVVGTDGSDTAADAVKEALRLTKLVSGELHIVSAYEPLRGTKVVGGPELSAAIVTSLPDSEVDRILAEAAALARIDGAIVHTHAIRKSPADALLEVADGVEADLIVVGSRGMHGAKRLVLGSVPNSVSHRARCNVLIVATDNRG
jgi:nucleotide-binding universal stress UspA family protein